MSCPVQLFDAEVEEVFTWFDRLRAVGPGGAIVLGRFPAAGGEGEQDDRLLTGLEIVRGVYEALRARSAARAEATPDG